MNYYVYEITNLINNKKYIGKRACNCSIEDDKYMGSGYALKEAIKKYGKENFKKDILIKCSSEDEAFAWEDFYTIQVNAWDNRDYYNLKRGGKGGKTELAKESKNKISIANKKHWENQDYRNRMIEIFKNINAGSNNPMYGKKHSQETKDKISLSNTGREFGKEHKQRCRERMIGRFTGEKHYNYGKKLSLETRLKMSKSRTGQKRSEETKSKMGKASTGRVMPKKSESKISVNVVCLNTGEVFGSMIEASEKYKVTDRMISQCCRGERKCASSSLLGGKTYWMYESEYLTRSKEDIENKIKELSTNRLSRSVICIDTNKIFKSISEASKFYDIKNQNISACCKGKIKSCKGLKFIYYDNFTKENRNENK